MKEMARKLKRINVLWSAALTVGSALFFATQSVALAGSYVSAGTSYTVAIDLDGDADMSSVSNYTGKGPGGQFAGQGISEFQPVKTGAGGCFLDATQDGCTVNGKVDGCLYEAVGGASENTYQGPFDVETFERVTGTDSTVCIDFDTPGGKPPFSTLGTMTDNRTGGTGRFAGQTGQIVTVVHGQIMTMDSTGAGFSWYRAVGN